MKHFFRWVGWTLLVFITVLLANEYRGIAMYDTCLFSLGGQSVVEFIPDLSPVLMALIYIIVISITIISIRYKKDYMIISFSNLALSVPVLFVLHRFFQSYPPLGNTEGFVLPIFCFLMYVYVSVVLAILFIVYTVIKMNRGKKQKGTPLADS